MRKLSLHLCFFVISLNISFATPIDPSNSNIQYMGRWNFDNPSEPWVAWKGSSIKVKFNGTAITGEFDAGSSTEQYRVIIDGVPNVDTLSMTNRKRVYTLASGLPSGEHIVEIMKETFNNNNTTFYGFEISGTIMAPPPRPSMRIEFFGDSNMDGTSLYSEQDSGDHGSYYAFPATVSRMLGVEFNDQSVGGATIDDGGVNDVRSFIKSADYYNENNWTPNFNPDVIVINAGANDVGAGENTIKNRYKAVIADLRTVYGSGPHIVLHNAYGWDINEPANYTMDLPGEVGGNLSVLHYPWKPQHWHGSMVEHAGQANLLADHIVSLGLGFTKVQESDVFDGYGHNFGVANGSFEYIAKGGFTSFGWRYIGDTGMERRYDPSGAYDGDYYLHLTSGGSGNAGSAQQGTDATGDFVRGGTSNNQKYYVTAMIRGASGGEQAQIILDYQGQQIWTRANAETVSFTVTSDWQEYTGEFTAPNGTWMTYVKLRASSGTVDFDAVRMSDTLVVPCGSGGDCDMSDLLEMINYWLSSDSQWDIAPDPGDGKVDVLDFADLSQHWNP